MDYKKEGEKSFKEATECVTTGIFRWKADYDTAATKFEKAGQYFRNAKLYTESIDSFAKAANAYFQINTFALAAKNAEEAGNVAKDQNKYKDASKYYEMGADYLQKGGKSERASALFVKAASVLTIKEKTQAIKLFKEALDIYSSNDAHHHAADVYRAFNTFLIKEKLFDEAITNVEKQVTTYQQLKQDHNKFKAMLAIVILRLKTGDWVKASNTLESWRDTESAFVYSDEGQIAQSLLDAFEANSEDQLQKVLKNSKIRLLENQIAKVALSLKCSDDPSAKTRLNTPKEKVIDSKKQALFGDSDDDVQDVVEEEPQESVFDENDAR